jgi:hypothetical protein
MLTKLPTKLEREWKNIEQCEMQEVSHQIGLNDDEQDDGYDYSENPDTANE